MIIKPRKHSVAVASRQAEPKKAEMPVVEEPPKPVRRERKRKERVEEIATPVMVETETIEEKANKIFEEIEQEVSHNEE